METLQLYSGNLASLSTPMDRLIKRQDQKSPRRIAPIVRDVETSDASEAASDLSSQDTRPDDAMSVGSLRASSDTLSVSRERFLETTPERKEQGGKNWSKPRMRRRNTIEKTKAMRRAHTTASPAQGLRC